MDAQLYRDFARLEESHWWFAGRRRILREVLRRWRSPSTSDRVLDVGCGTGGMIPMLREFGVAEGMDGSPDALGFARERLGADVPLHQGDLPAGLPPKRTWDLITAFDVIEHVAEPVEALRAILAALAPQGTFVCSVPAFQFLWSKHDELNHHFRRYNLALLRSQLTEAGFEVQFISYFNSWLFPPVAMLRLARNLVGSDAGQNDVAEVPPLLNGVLTRLFASERFAVSRFPLPFGVSLLAVARRAVA